MQLGSMFIAVTNKHTAKLHHVDSFIYIYEVSLLEKLLAVRFDTLTVALL